MCTGLNNYTILMLDLTAIIHSIPITLLFTSYYKRVTNSILNLKT